MKKAIIFILLVTLCLFTYLKNDSSEALQHR